MPRPTAATGAVLAAGGVLWRPAQTDPGDGAVQVALVHRPKYDDWSLPKGKLNPGEHLLAAALREIVEETGHEAVPGRPLGTSHYLADGMPKTVHYWAMAACDGRFVAHAEVDALRWLAVATARTALTHDRDRDVLDTFAAGPTRTAAVVLVRHARAGKRKDWTGDDRVRPLDARGAAQAEALAPLLAAYRPVRILSADVLRCIATVEPLAQRTGLAVQSAPELSEEGYAAHPDRSLALVEHLLAGGEQVVVCSQGGAIPDLVRRLLVAHDVPPPADTTLPKGGLWVLHTAPPRIVAFEKHQV